LCWVWSKVMAEFGLLHFSAVFTCFFFYTTLTEDDFSLLFDCLAFWTPVCFNGNKREIGQHETANG
jgi:hypothetical protein